MSYTLYRRWGEEEGWKRWNREQPKGRGGKNPAEQLKKTHR